MNAKSPALVPRGEKRPATARARNAKSTALVPVVEKHPAKVPARNAKSTAVVPLAEKRPATVRAREWIDVFGYGAEKTIRGILPVVVGGVGGLELFGPDILSSIHMSTEWASALFAGACGYYGLPIMQGGGTKQKRGPKE